MSLHIQHLNADATFLLTFTSSSSTKPFTLLLDPWLVSDAPVFHTAFSNQVHTVTPHINTLSALPSPPSLVLASQDKSDHVHEETLQQLDWSSSAPATHLFAVPGAANTVRGWKWFPRDRVTALRARRKYRVSCDGGGYVELEYLPPRYPWEIAALHSAVGITFYGSDAEIVFSVLFTPHGSPLSGISSWLQQLPDEVGLSVLMAPWNLIETPIWLGGVISSGFPAGVRICEMVKTRMWIRTHDEEKMVTGFVEKRLKKRGFEGEEVRSGCKDGGHGVECVDMGVGEERELAVMIPREEMEDEDDSEDGQYARVSADGGS